jgi:DNA-binding response OmpR family regulator
MEGRIRVLVVDGSTLMGWLVQSLSSASIDIVYARSFGVARGLLEHHPPHAAIFNITPSELPWHELRDLCRCHQPAIPFLCFSAVEEGGDEVAVCDGAEILYKPVPTSELRARVEDLVTSAQNANSTSTQNHDEDSGPKPNSYLPREGQFDV